MNTAGNTPVAPDQRVYVALGSNLGDRRAHLKQAIEHITDLPGCSCMVVSSVYETDPMGPQEQPDYLNAVCAFNYRGQARALMLELQRIERAHGRTQNSLRWSARPLDLDILLFGQALINEPDLQIPHYGIAQRSFVLWPLAELDSELEIPGLGPVTDLLQACQKFGIRKIQQS